MFIIRGDVRALCQLGDFRLRGEYLHCSWIVFFFLSQGNLLNAEKSFFHNLALLIIAFREKSFFLFFVCHILNNEYVKFRTILIIEWVC